MKGRAACASAHYRAGNVCWMIINGILLGSPTQCWLTSEWVVRHFYLYGGMTIVSGTRGGGHRAPSQIKSECETLTLCWLHGKIEREVDGVPLPLLEYPPVFGATDDLVRTGKGECFDVMCVNR